MIIGLTGGSSFRGELLLSKLIAQPNVHTIHVFDIKSPTIHSHKIITHRVDLLHEDASEILEMLMSKNNVEVLVHGALFSGPQKNKSLSREIESIGTFHVLNACAGSKIKHLIVLSDTFVYGALSYHPNFISENYPLSTAGVPLFVKTRVDVERQVQEYAKDYKLTTTVTVLRFAPILGPNSTNTRAQYFLAGLVPKVMGFDPLLQFIHEEDASNAMWCAIENKQVGVFNFAGHGLLPLTTAAHLAGKLPLPVPAFVCKGIFAFGKNLGFWKTSSELISFFQYLCVAETKKSVKFFQFQPKYSSRQALKSMIEAFKLQRYGMSDRRFKETPYLGEELSIAVRKEYRRI
jgi:UDP-glucose 4-epimerase